MQIGKKELDVRAFFTEAYEGQVPHDRSVQQLYTQYMTTSTETGVSYGLFNGVVKKLKDGTEPNSLVPVQPVTPTQMVAEVIEIGKYFNKNSKPPTSIFSGSLTIPLAPNNPISL